jgi:hypothetical protein
VWLWQTSRYRNRGTGGCFPGRLVWMLGFKSRVCSADWFVYSLFFRPGAATCSSVSPFLGGAGSVVTCVVNVSLIFRARAGGGGRVVIVSGTPSAYCHDPHPMVRRARFVAACFLRISESNGFSFGSIPLMRLSFSVEGLKACYIELYGANLICKLVSLATESLFWLSIKTD